MKAINNKISALWDSTPKEFLNGLMPVYFSKIPQNTILFVGINPSFSDKGFNAVFKGTEFENLDFKKFFRYPDTGSFDLAKSLKIEKFSSQNHPYFKKFETLSKAVSVPWSHVDLFFIRETNQKVVKNMILSKGGKLNDFGKAQVEISKSVIADSKPKVIIVANALASKIFCDEFEAIFRPELGCYTIELQGEQVPVFLTSMLTGQRALDNFSFERLCWHVGWVLERK